MAIQIIGAGLGRTGTLSLKLALERLLGGTCHHMIEVFARPDELAVWEAAMRGEPVDWASALADYTAIVDFPGAAVWKDIAAAFPDAPVLLSTRASAQEWWDSASATILVDREPGDDEFAQRLVAMATAMFEMSLCDDRHDAAAAQAAYDAHNADVRASVPPERLVEYRPGDGWTPLCRALGVDEPDEPFPHTNTRQQFRAGAGLDAI